MAAVTAVRVITKEDFSVPNKTLQFQEVRCFEPKIAETGTSNEANPCVLCVSNRFGVSFVVIHGALHVLESRSLLVDPDLPPSVKTGVCAIGLSCDESLLAVATGSDVSVYETNSFVLQPTTVVPKCHFIVSKSGATTHQIAWNPAEPKLIAGLGSDGALAIIKILDNWSIELATHTDSSFKCMSWSPKGKQLSVGGSKSIVQLKTDLKKAKEVALVQGQSAVSIFWLSNTQFLLGMVPTNSNPTEMKIMLLTVDKTEAVYHDYGDIFVSDDLSHPLVTTKVLSEWKLHIFGSSTSSDIIVASYDHGAGNADVVVQEIEDQFRPAAPLDHFCTGLGLYLGNQDPVTIEGEELHSTPILIVLTQKGTLKLFKVANQGFESIFKPAPEPLKPGVIASRLPPAYSAPRSESTITQPTPVTQPFPTTLPSFSFGSPSSLGSSTPFLSASTGPASKSLFGDIAQKSVSSVPVVSSPAVTSSSPLFSVQTASATSVAKPQVQIPEIGTNPASQAGGDTFASPLKRNEDLQAEQRKQKFMIILEAMKQFEKRFKAHKKSYPRPSFCQVEAAEYDQWLETDFLSDLHMLIDFAKDIQDTTDGQSEEVNMLHITMQQLFTKVEHACVAAVKTTDSDYLTSLKALPLDSISMAKLIHLEKLHAGFGNRLKECARYFSMKEKGDRPMDRTTTSEIIRLAIDRHSIVLENLRQKIEALRRRFEVIQGTNAGRLPSDSVISLDDLESGISRLKLKSRDRKSEVSGTRASLNSATAVSNYNRTTVDVVRSWAEHPVVTLVKVSRGIDPYACYPKVAKIRPAKDMEQSALVSSKPQSSNIAPSPSAHLTTGQGLSAFASNVSPELSQVGGNAGTVTFLSAPSKLPFGASSTLGNVAVLNASASTATSDNIASEPVKFSVAKAPSAVGFGTTNSSTSAGTTPSMFGSTSFASPVFDSSKPSVGTTQASLTSSGLGTPPTSTTIFGAALSPSLLQSGDSPIANSATAAGGRSDSLILSTANTAESPKPPMTSIFTLKSANASASSAATPTSVASAPVFSFGSATQGSLFGVTQSRAPTGATDKSGSMSTLSGLGTATPLASGTTANVFLTKPMFGVSTTAPLGSASSLLLSNTTKPLEVAKAPATVINSSSTVSSPATISSSSPALKAALTATSTGEKVTSTMGTGTPSSLATVKPFASVTPSITATKPGASVGASVLTSSSIAGSTGVPTGTPTVETSLSPSSVSFPKLATGSPASVTSTSSTGLGSTAASSAPSSLFGSLTATTTSSLFGPTTATSKMPSLFGSTVSTTTSPSLTGTVSASASLPLFGATKPATTTPSLLGSTTSTPVTSSVVAPTPSTTTSLFGAVTTTTSSLFGSAAATTASSFFGNTTPGASVFGSPSTTVSSSLFGSTPKTAPSVLGATTATVTPMLASTTAATTPVFGATTTSAPSIFGSATAATTPSLFGSPAVTSTPSAFGSVSTGSTPSLFGSPDPNSSPLFGATATAATPSAVSSTTTQPPFGTTGSTAPSMFGSTTGQSQAASAFGSTFGSSNTPQVTQSSLFGGSSNPVAAFGSLNFGGGDVSSTQSKPAVGFGSTPFGASSSSDGKDGQPPSGLFSSVLGSGSPAASQGSTSPFGGGSGFSSPAFGSASALKPSALSATTNIFGGGSSSTSAFGGTPGAAKEGSVFGGSPFGSSGFGTSSQQASPFGGAQQSVFGASTSAFGGTTAQPSAFGAKPAFGSPSQPAFGASATPAAAFGTAPVFGGSPAFGGGAVFGGMSTFGSGGASPSVGSGSIFGGTATQQASGFGSLASTSPSPNTGSVFGGGSQQSTFGSFGSFGNQANPAQSQSGFAGGSTFGAFGQTQQPPQQQATPTFGGTSFSSWR